MTSFTCPVDGATLVPVERQGIELDHCPTCRGVWLDRGELDKIIERSAAPAPALASQGGYEGGYGRQPHHDDRHRDQGGAYRPKRKRSFLEDLFD